ncbi:GNAT family N-acetyltransferase [Metabacillus malikii]|uniref:Ribosomal-protein-alanine N-acetyltransferase n=1 Tax=Metabacillus malikii TaxID=1504265 RepID=A0ABT9ZHP5_9BACI|nr:GNAT family N-acetyltransferase [Metabacillus malikii]MDQ0231806.1 ribosomal-protein-alanine N-acetyltransferase [Metabacillus malikii]
MIKELYTNRLYLREISIDDAPALFTIWSDRDVTRFMNISPFTKEAQVLEMIQLLNQLAEEKKAVRFSMIHKETKELIGTCGFNTLDFENMKTEIGYDLAKPYWGNGYALEAINALVSTAFTTLNFNRVEAKVEPENKNSIKVLERGNFIFEGILRQSELSKGKFIDLSIYSKLQSD